MADMELVIKIPEEIYKNIMSVRFCISGLRSGKSVLEEILKAIITGTPLPKGHGKLIDINNIDVIELEDSIHFIQHKKGDEVDVYISAPTIIEAESEDKE